MKLNNYYKGLSIKERKKLDCISNTFNEHYQNLKAMNNINLD